SVHGGTPAKHIMAASRYSFVAPPGSLYALRWALGKPPAVCFKISLLLAAVVFFAKVSGLVVFSPNFLGGSLLYCSSIIAPIPSMLATWSASGIVAVLFLAFGSLTACCQPTDRNLP